MSRRTEKAGDDGMVTPTWRWGRSSWLDSYYHNIHLFIKMNNEDYGEHFES